jgi:hypothetical protein
MSDTVGRLGKITQTTEETGKGQAVQTRVTLVGKREGERCTGVGDLQIDNGATGRE